MPVPDPQNAQDAQLERTGSRLALRGRLDVDAAARLWHPALEALDAAEPGEVALDVSGLDYCDGGGAALLVALRRRQEARGGRLTLRGVGEDLAGLLALVEPPPEAGLVDAGAGPGFLERLGREALDVARGWRALVVYTGELALHLAAAIRRPRLLRVRDTFAVAERAGLGAIPIMVGIGFLLGLILAFQSAIPMRRFGAQLFVADLVGISMLRELGPLMAAILLTARSGSAFAAELGTMKVNEEIDALTTMGLPAVRFLVLPRVVAAVLVVPALAVLVDFAGLAGGAVMFLVLDFPLVTYVNRVTDAVGPADFLGGIFKAFFFGLIVAAVGCLRGLQTGVGAGAVGLSTTSAVVSGITLIAVADGAFAVIFYVLGI